MVFGVVWFVKNIKVVLDVNIEICSFGVKYYMENVGTGMFIVNGEVKKVVDVYGLELF